MNLTEVNGGDYGKKGGKMVEWCERLSGWFPRATVKIRGGNQEQPIM
jgi:hypothetical protein